jgi:thioredoxin
MSELLTLQSFRDKIFNYETDRDWNYRGDLPAIVDFYADWCGPCKMVAPILDRLSRKYEGKIHVYKVDTEAEPELSGMFGIQSIPTILFIPMKGEPQAVMGALPEKEFERVIAELLLPEAKVEAGVKPE